MFKTILACVTLWSGLVLADSGVMPEGPRRHSGCEDHLEKNERDAHFKDWVDERLEESRRRGHRDNDVDPVPEDRSSF